ncbi:CKLF-like MARVEL transmembrane domain-containing protein 6 [Pyrgilauda ruficollis]|uniref:CKLF-like MARVEL transmembrane domain-containing protein 6 n=1 Tax=Pyrgilauda ruficollis TaxID=221976 RepID=UPI001B86A2DF|nr:CKLF-like MARVEL transmembrane domain-containing protein 6 [Pyrgilauda ruficollis]
MGTVYNQTREPEASRRLPSFLSRFFPDGSRRPAPAMENRTAYNQTREPEASRCLPPFFLRCCPAGNRQPSPARQNRAAYNQTTEPQASRYLPHFFLRCCPAGNRQPSPARQNRAAYNQTTEPQASRYLPHFFLRCFPAGNRRPGPTRESGSAYKQTAEREAKTPCPPPFCFRFFPAGSRRPGPGMENGAVYNETTEPQAKGPRRRPLGCTLRRLRGWRLPVKVAQTIFSFVAVVCEEVVDECITCSGLYFFEFTSCSAFLLSLLILYVYCTDFYESLGEDKVKKLNFWAVPVIGAWFLLASIVFSATCSDSAAESAACVFGFFATFAFAAEFGRDLYELYRKRKQNIDGRPENPRNTPSAIENQPLNKQR